MVLTVLLLILTGICTLTDLRDGRIYNAVTVPVCLLGLAMRMIPACGGSAMALGAAILRMGAVLLLFLPFWALIPGGIGGGDAKLYAAVAVLVEGRALLVLVFLSLLVAAGYGWCLRIVQGRSRRIRIGPAVLCAAVLYAGGIYG